MDDEKKIRRPSPSMPEEERLRRKREDSRRYRESHPEDISERKRRWRQANQEHVKEYAAQYRERNLDRVRRENRDRERKKAARIRQAKQAAEHNRERGRKRYAADPQAHLKYQRERRAAQRAADPEGYREAKRLRTKRWHDKHRERENAKLRLKHRDNPEIKRAAAERYYAENGDKVRERRKAYYWANREKQLEKQRQWREREKRRRALGLPPRRLHRVSAEERKANLAAADDFFALPRSRDRIEEMRRGPATSAEELAKLDRLNARARLAWALQEDPDLLQPIHASERRARDRAAAADRKREAEAAEQARMDAIAVVVNERLRQASRRPPANRGIRAPLPPAITQSGGLSL